MTGEAYGAFFARQEVWQDGIRGQMTDDGGQTTAVQGSKFQVQS